MEVFYQGAECDIHVQFVIKWAISSRSAEQNKGTFTNAQEGILFHDAEVVDLAGAFQNEAASARDCALLSAEGNQTPPGEGCGSFTQKSDSPDGFHVSS